MTSDILIRDLGKAEQIWLEDAKPPGVSKNEFLKILIAQAMDSDPQPTLSTAVSPKTIHGNMPFKFIDLFAGIGGFRIGMTAAGGECVFSSEWDKYAAKSYQAWFGDGPEHMYTGDIGDIDIESQIPEHDVLCAGFPCQPFSLAGVSKKNSLGRAHGFEDAKQGNLFFKIMDIVDIKRPPVLVLENVKNLRSHDKGNTWKVIEESIRERDYAIYTEVIDARHWVPQHRERVFIVCFDKQVFGREDQVKFNMPKPDKNNNPTLSTILSEEAPDKKYMLSDKLWKYLVGYAAKHKAKGNGFGYGLNTPKDVSRTMSARYHKDGAEILIKQKGWRNPRRLTPREAMLLLGYCSRYSELFGHEDGFPQVVSDTQAYRQFGNSVVPLIVEEIGHEVVRCMAEVIQRAGSGCILKARNVSTY
jgi:DNA (cytosine-5)-methyltransferase 1